jgi:hypothetical protein
MNYSPFVKKNIESIEFLNYEIYPKGNQIYKKIDNYEILITDFSMKSSFFNYTEVVNILVWIKQSKTDLILNEKRYSGGFFLPSLKKVNRDILKIIAELQKN